MSEEREERTLLALAQEQNTLLLQAVGILRDIAADVKQIVSLLPQKPAQLKSLVTIFGEPT
jgi:hypothetical protein